MTLEGARSDLIDAVEKWANADCGATEAEEVLGRLAIFNTRRLSVSAKPTFRVPRAALAAVINLATYGKFDRNGEGTGLEKDDVDVIVKVCAAFRIELPDSPYLPKKPKKSKKK